MKTMTWVVGALLLAGAAGGCASSGTYRSKAPPSSPGEARSELDQLEREIARNRIALGLPARVVTRSKEISAVEKAPAGGAAGAADAAPSPAVVAAKPAESPPPASPDRSSSAQLSSEARDEDGDDREEDAVSEPSCSDPCRITFAICDAADRICRLAKYLGEPDAIKRCKRAREDCRDAREATRDRSCPAAC